MMEQTMEKDALLDALALLLAGHALFLDKLTCAQLHAEIL